MSLTRRVRSLKSVDGGSYRQIWQGHRSSDGIWEVISGNSFQGTDFSNWHGSQITDSEEHQWPPEQGAGDVGGPFWSQKQTISKRYGPFAKTLYKGSSSNPRYDNERLICSFSFSCPIETVGSTIPQPKWPTALNSNSSSITALGATAASRCRPTAAESNLSTALGEIFRDGFPQIVGSRTWSDRTLRARNAGDEYLNVEFGWLPLVSDVTAFGRTVAKSHDIIQQYERDAGRLVRRSYRFPSTMTSTTVDLGTAFPNGSVPISVPSSGWGSSTNGKWSKTTTTKIDRWFKGAFVYGVPLNGNHVEANVGQAAVADKLFNLSLSPDVLWNLTPWSWAVDWFTNTGDVLAYASDVISQGLVMQYGYLMEHTINKVTYSLEGATYRGYPLKVPSATLVTETKSRTKANPFGFGITWNGLSPFQASILAALGISRT